MKSLLSAAALAVAALCASAPASAANVTFMPSATQINIGQTVTVDVGISGLGSELVSGFDVNFVYQSAVLNWVKTTFEAAQFGMIFPDPIGTSGGPGNLGYDVISLEDDVTLAGIQTDDAFRLFTLEFTGAIDGAATLTLGAGPDERLFSGLGGANPGLLSVNVGSVCIAVGTGTCGGGASQPIPEPATYGLAAIALLAAGAAGRRRRPAAAG